GEVETPLPHLILIVDEFAELKAEQPDFMKELISAARIGRSLGVHLILATQKPSGQVDDQIWSNSRFKLCLKVQDQADSNEVLKSPLAAEIKEPGRAYLQVGNNEIFELFQSAYSGAPEKADNSNFKEFSVYALTDSGRRVPVYVQKKKKSDQGNRTQLEAIVDFVNDYTAKNHIEKLPDICLPPLEKAIDYAGGAVDELSVPIGVYDDPDNQIQPVFSINIFSDNTLIIGSSMSGKTNLLQLILRGIADNYSPDEVSVYIIDFASMVLKNFEGLNHVGGVVVSNEDEKLKNLFKLLTQEIEQRKEKLLAAGVSNFLSYKEAGNTDIPQIVLMIDNLTALNELYLQDDDVLLNLTREGLAVGISVIVANSQTSGIGYRYMSNFSSKVALFCNDSGEYSTVFDYCRMSIEPIAGRSIVEKDKQHYECQTYLAFKGEKEFERVAQMKEFIAQANEKYPSSKANIIPVIPELLTQQFVDTQLGFALHNKYDVVVGLNYANVSPFVLNLAAMGTLTVSGREDSGRSNFIRYVLSTMEKRNADSVQAYVIDNVSRKLASVQSSSIVDSYSIVADTAVETIISIEEELKTRYEALMDGNDSVIDTSKLIILVLNNADALESISNDSKAFDAYRNINGRYKNLNVCIIVGDYPNTNISYSSPELMRNLRDARHFLYFDDMDAMKIIDLPLAVMRAFKKPIDNGDCYYINDNDAVKIKTVRS
ncbi:MAG: FtsK/SpoIIIE domain-containing protein, partial [Eubacterium sp.]